MKKTIIAASALSCILISSASFAQDNKPTGFYLKGFYDYSFNPSMYGVGAGYKFGLFRAEGQYSYGQHSHNALNGQHVTAHQHNVNAVGYLDLDNKTIFSPYAGLGLGYVDRSFSQSPFSSYKAQGATLIGAIGTRVYLKDNLALDLGYKTSFASLSAHNVNFDGAATFGLAYHF